jgi:hypothetical protein
METKTRYDVPQAISLAIGATFGGPVVLGPLIALCATGLDDLWFVLGMAPHLPQMLLLDASSHNDAFVTSAPLTLVLLCVSLEIAWRLPRELALLAMWLVGSYSLASAGLGVLCLLGRSC